MTITKLNSAEGAASNGALVTAANSGGSSGDAWSLVSYPSGSATYDTAAASHGTYGVTFAPAASQQCLVRWSGFLDTTGVMRRFVTIDTLPASGSEAMFSANTASGGGVIALAVNAAGKYAVLDSTGATIGTVTTNSYTAGDRVELSWTVGTTSSNGAFNFSLYRADATSATESKSSVACNLSNSGANTQWDRAIFGKTSTSSWVGVSHGDDFAAASGTTTFFGVPAAAPNVAFTVATSGAGIGGLSVTSDGTGSTPNGSATISSYSWNWGDASGTTSGSTSSHTYSAGGTYTVTLTVTDSLGGVSSKSYPIQVQAPAGLGGVAVFVVASGWTLTPSTGSTEQAILNDSDGNSFEQSPNNPSASTQTIPLQKLAYIPGQGVDINLTIDRIGGTSGTVTVALREGTTTIATSASLTPSVGTSGSAVTATVVASFSAAQCASVVDWGNVNIVLSATGS